MLRALHWVVVVQLLCSYRHTAPFDCLLLLHETVCSSSPFSQICHLQELDRSSLPCMVYCDLLGHIDVCHDDCCGDAIDCCCGVVSLDIGSASTGWLMLFHDGVTSICAA